MLSQEENSHTGLASNNSKEQVRDFNHREWSLERFMIARPLGSGRFGRVYLAMEKASNFICVLKSVSIGAIESNKQVMLLAREVEINSNLSHDNILKMYGFFCDGDRFYFILEYAEDGDLYGNLKKQPNGRYQESTSSTYVRQLICALIYLHSKHILHRDIKPENILLTNVAVSSNHRAYSS